MTNKNITTFSNKFSKKHSKNICLYTGKNQAGQYVWFYLLLSNIKKERFLLEYKNGVNLSDYGEVIFSGHGKYPPLEIKELVKKEYGLT